ncbi:hypothetical protein CVV26_01315 [Candidatus Kuenenbacteria bacterium HGW-Kuenenbacteria-1]|uniref:Uncharacterized protein n=1 Tax=Candidatus Kuenenbacteria bacterium HGW-Kuenenbacteria-1 TaxID=2013812 RepID=A0A2N1UNX9_9BACT|nr:MAG: hypothetical protein CVV26_01315 [Candidatus Kuenenbacteria bacterium HGW-Kuenenbacteria-1]
MAFFNKKKEENNGDDGSYKKESELKLESTEKPSAEIIKEPEIIEKEEEREEGIEPQKPEEALKKTPSFQASPIPSTIIPLEKILKSETRQTIEKILSEDLEDIFFKLPLEKQEEIQEKKEEISFKIEEIINGVKIKISKIFKLIKEWLKLIPGVNNFFLEQETKIKIDGIIELSKKIKTKTTLD